MTVEKLNHNNILLIHNLLHIGTVRDYVQNFRDQLSDIFNEEDINHIFLPSKSIPFSASENTSVSKPYEAYLIAVNPQDQFEAAEYPQIQVSPP